MKVENMWDGPAGPMQPVEVVVQSDWEFHNPIAGSVLKYEKGTVVTVSMLVPASRNEPFGFPFFWGDDGVPYPAWLVEPRDEDEDR